MIWWNAIDESSSARKWKIRAALPLCVCVVLVAHAQTEVVEEWDVTKNEKQINNKGSIKTNGRKRWVDRELALKKSLDQL